MLSLPGVDRKSYERWRRGPSPRIWIARAALGAGFGRMAPIVATSTVGVDGSVAGVVRGVG